MTTNILDPSAIISSIPAYLPPNSKTLASQQDAIAALIHTALSALAFRLTDIEEPLRSPALSTNILPDAWNKSGPGHYTFTYKHDQSSLEFVMKVSKLGTRTVINAIALESDKIATLDISTNDFTSTSFYPHNLDASNAQPLVHGFISSNRVADLLSQFKIKIIQNLVPGLRKDGYIEEGTNTSSGSNAPSQQPSAPRPRPQSPPEAPERERYLPPSAIPRNPLEIGRRDLDPFPPNPFAPPSLFPTRSGDGMFVGPDHPIFGMRGGNGNQSPRGPWGGDGFLPPMGAPPGARFDPVGPIFPRGGFPPNGPGRGSRGPGGQNPDNDEFMPPGMGDMFM